MPGEAAASPTRGRIALLVIAVVLLGVLGGVLGWRLHSSHNRAGGTQAVVTSEPVARLAPASGVYRGAGDPVPLVQFGRWRKVPVKFALDYVPTTNWHDIASPLWLLGRWQGSGFRLMLGVPMLPDHGSASLAQGAQGRYDRYFRELAQHLVHYGAGSASLRVGWEMNGGWYRWSAAKDPSTWIAFYRRIVTTMRSVPGAKFTFVWNPNTGTRSMNAEAAYPGDKYVDQIGMDVYDWEWNAPDATPQSRWVWIETHTNGLNWLASFGALHHKPISLPEWGLAQPQDNANGGGGDDPYFVSHLLDWASTHKVVAEAYFDDGTHQLAGFPAAQRTYLDTERSLARLPPA